MENEIDGTVRNVRTFNTTDAFTTTNTMYIFQATGSTVIGSAKIYSFKIRDNGTLVRDFVPVKLTNGSTVEYAMLDKVENKIYHNAGTGSFTGGPSVPSNLTYRLTYA